MKTPPAFFDDGHDGTWLDMIHHSPCLNVSDYRPRELRQQTIAGCCEARPADSVTSGCGITGSTCRLRMVENGEITEDARGCLANRDAAAASVSFPFHAGETSDA